MKGGRHILTLFYVYIVDNYIDFTIIFTGFSNSRFEVEELLSLCSFE